MMTMMMESLRTVLPQCNRKLPHNFCEWIWFPSYLCYSVFSRIHN